MGSEALPPPSWYEARMSFSPSPHTSVKPEACSRRPTVRGHDLEFAPPDFEAFPALGLGFAVAQRGGTCGAVLNAANEVAVERFLRGDLKFVDIPRVCSAVLERHEFDPTPDLSELLRMDVWAREETRRWRS